ncbi:hypothetical protein KQH61_04210 [bacterium]|nr:hypothetical protein [bacterium]MCB2179107.1 hypothetical protein [bacterium]
MPNQDKTAPFVHEAEKIFAQILDFYGVSWEYEPRTFPLERDENGNVTEAFAPDFYLPEQDLYVELTTVRPELSSFKNRKLKRMQELYPDINIKLFKRREVRNLMLKYGLLDEAAEIAGSKAQHNSSHKAAG